MAGKKKIRFNKYDSEESFGIAVENGHVDNATFSVVRTDVDGDGDADNDIKDLYLYKSKLTDTYNSRKTGTDVKTSVTVGGIKAGTPLDELRSLSLGQVIDRMLFRTTYPVVGTPVSVSVSYGKTDFLVGTYFPDVTNVTVNKGSYRIDKDGTPVSAGVISNGLDSFTTVPTPSDRKTSPGTNSIKVAAYALSGPTPKDSDGNPYTSTDPVIPYQGGVFTSTVTIYPYYDWFATGDKVTSETQTEPDYTVIKELAVMPFTRNMGTKDSISVMVDICGGDSGNRQTIKVPGTIEDCKTYVSGTWVDYAFTDYYGESTETINGKTYHVYRMKPEVFGDGPVGGTRLKFTVRKTNN